MNFRIRYKKLVPYKIRKIRSDIFFWGKMIPRWLLYSLSMNLIRQLIVKEKLSSIQIGAGAGSLDPIIKKDGFQNLLTKVHRKFLAKVHLYEPNPLNIKVLKKSWKSIESHVKIYQKGLSLKKEKLITFYMHPKDGPHYQVCSIDPYHVLKHFKDSDYEQLLTFESECIPIDSIIDNAIYKDNSQIFIAMDVEGIDYPAMKEIFNSSRIVNVAAISFESKHLSRIQYLELEKLAKKNNFTKAGLGVDPYFCDTLYVKRKYFFKNHTAFLIKILDKIDYLWREIILI